MLFYFTCPGLLSCEDDVRACARARASVCSYVMVMVNGCTGAALMCKLDSEQLLIYFTPLMTVSFTVD